jgi:hypothetical protein
MEFGKHGTFYIRNGWISKGINVIENEDKKTIFSPKHMEYAIDCLGIGQAMVASLRYWLDVFGITYEKKENNEIIKEFTEFGKFIKEKDRYLERKGTLWLLHYNLANKKEEATAWYWFFNVFNYNEFDEALFIQKLEDYIYQNSYKKISVNTLKKDFLCLKNTYLFENYDNHNTDFEEMISSPLKELKLITVSTNNNMYIKNKGNLNEIAPEIFYYTIIVKLGDEIRQVSIDDIAYKEGFPGKIFNLSINDVFEMLNVIESKNYIKINRKYGDNHIEILERDVKKVLNNYYSNKKLD